jgi:hypothetical protein
MVTSRYRIRFGGELSGALTTFPGFEVVAADGAIVLCGVFDQAGLHGVLERIRRSGYEVIDVHRVVSEGSQRAGAPRP